MQEVWLTATTVGVSVQPMSALTFLLTLLEHGGSGFSQKERDELSRIRQLFHDVLERADADFMFILRFAIADPPSAVSLRRAVEDVLEFEPSVVNERNRQGNVHGIA